MESQMQSGEPGVPPTAPPIVPGVLPARKSAWPTVLGVIAIAFGALGVLGGIVGVIMSLVMDEMIAEQLGGAVGLLNQALGFALSVLLLVGGIGLTMRRRWAARAMLIWAGLAIFAALFSTVIGYQVQQQQMEQLQAQGGPAPRWMLSSMPLFMLLGLLWALALPVFTLIWLRRPVIREETAQWQ